MRCTPPHDPQNLKERPTSPLRTLTLGLTLTLLCLGCVEAPLVISEVSLPQVSSDAGGPYAILIRTSGVVDELRADWSREAPEDSPQEATLDPIINQQGMTLATFDGEVWTVRIPGGAPVADYRFSLTASNSTQSARYPAEGEVTFKVRSLNGRCSSDAQCLTGEVCHRAEGYCFEPPELCTRDLHCPRDQYCNLETSACRFYDTACEDDSGCAGGYLCQEGTCVQPCDGRCGGGYLCDGVNCVAPPCEGASDCPAELPLCEEGRCAPAPSTCTPECASNEVCVLGSCMPAPCGTGGPCATGSVCVDGQCVGCQADGQCGPGRRCDLDSSRCVDGERARLCAPCHEAIDGVIGCGDTLTCVDTYPGCRQRCSSDNDCQDGYCQEGGCLSFGWETCEGERCSTDNECDSGEVCLAGFCERGQRCSVDTDCARDMRCSAEGLCTLRSPCAHDWGPRCATGEVCVAGRCEVARDPAPSECLPCNSDLDCGPQQACGFFYAGYAICATLCDTNCAEGEYCEPVSPLTSVCTPFEGCGESFDCGWDEWEPNDDPMSAPVIDVSADMYLEGWICSRDEDWYQLYNPSRIDLTLFADIEELYFELYDEDFNPIEVVSSDPFVGQRITSEAVWMRASTSWDFEEMFWIIADGSSCEEDIFEPNDEQWSAYPIGDGAFINAMLCQGDIDWYEITPARRNRMIDVYIYRWSFLDRLMYFALLDENGNLLDEQISQELEVNLSYFQEEREPVYLEVQCFEGCDSPEPYEVNVDIWRP